MTVQTDLQLRGIATFSSWAEDPPYDGDAPLPRLAHARVAFTWAGDVAGTSTCEYAMRYGAAGDGDSVGYELVTATVDGEATSFVLRHECRFAADAVEVTWSIVEGTATGALEGATGTGGFRAAHGEPNWPWTLDVRR
ncbi:MAG: DUF3224 domain-containing protein [Actinomycetota bacterium]|nr:DUF3224 domain-containing protein [Actinomycetota bacterium]